MTTPATPSQTVYIVVKDPEGLYGAWCDETVATQHAQDAQAVVVALPITSDFRVQSP